MPAHDAPPVSLPTVDRQHEGLPASALAGMLLAASLAPLGSTMIAVALPSIGRDTGAEAAELTQWLVSSYLIASIALRAPAASSGISSATAVHSLACRSWRQAACSVCLR
jgi:hypothetical protein